MIRFFRRLKLAWKVFRDPSFLDVLLTFEKLQDEDREYYEFLAGLKKNVKGVTNSLLEGNPRDKPKSTTVLLTMKSDSLLTPKEADQVVEESRIDYQIPSPHEPAAKKRMTEYQDKLNKKRSR